jgi:hypothetical protein
VDDGSVAGQHHFYRGRQSAGQETKMPVQDAEILELKLVMLTAAVTEMARALSPRDAATVAGSLGPVLSQLLGEISLSARADEALATDLAPLMAALQRDTPATMDWASAGSDQPDQRCCVSRPE